jgi:hypothetical protein
VFEYESDHIRYDRLSTFRYVPFFILGRSLSTLHCSSVPMGRLLYSTETETNPASSVSSVHRCQSRVRRPRWSRLDSAALYMLLAMPFHSPRVREHKHKPQTRPTTAHGATPLSVPTHPRGLTNPSLSLPTLTRTPSPKKPPPVSLSLIPPHHLTNLSSMSQNRRTGSPGLNSSATPTSVQ